MEKIIIEDRTQRSVWTIAAAAVALFAIVFLVFGMLGTPEVATLAAK